MKIIKPGFPPKEKIVRLQCGDCGCEFEAKAGEIERVPDQRDGDFWRCKCPQAGCGKQVTSY
jgi:hypothetical protein